MLTDIAVKAARADDRPRKFWDERIELQLAHRERDESRAACNRAQRLADGRTMTQWWADYLDSLKQTKSAPPTARK